ncbi:MAG: hypothetical protein ACR2PO_11935 [Methyloligellaceae bacterium]
MKQIIRLLLSVLASLVLIPETGTAAEPWTWPGLTPPPAPKPNVEVGVRYWVSEGQTKFQFDSSGASPILGNPTSVLDYDDIETRSAEFVFRIENEAGTFFKGFVGGGSVDDGTLDDEDFFAGQIKFSDTLSEVDGDGLFYFSLDVGKTFSVTRPRGTFSISPLVGVSFWRENVIAKGVQCNADDLGGLFCGAPGQVVIPFGTQVITNEQDWTSLRIGAEARATLFDKLTLIADVAVLPIAYLDADDSHHLRTDLGPVPNIRYRGTGHGFQFEALARYAVTPKFTIGGGVRYWHAETDGEAEFVHFTNESDLTEYESDRFGVFGELIYQFSFN